MSVGSGMVGVGEVGEGGGVDVLVGLGVEVSEVGELVEEELVELLEELLELVEEELDEDVGSCVVDGSGSGGGGGGV